MAKKQNPKKLVEMTKEAEMIKKDMAEEAKRRKERQSQPISFTITPPKKK